MSHIAFVATREPSYSRIAIFRAALADAHDVDEYLSHHTAYPIRLVSVCLQLIAARLTGRLKRADVVVVGFLAQPIVPLIRLLCSQPVIVDAYVSMFDTLVYDKRTVKAGSITARLVQFLDRLAIRFADHVLTDTQQHADYWHETYDCPLEKVTPIWVSTQHKPLSSTQAAPAHEESFRVVFWGGFIPLQGVDTIIRSAKILSDRNERVDLLLLGRGQTFDACTQLAKDLAVDNISFAGIHQPKFSSDDVVQHASRSHLALGIFGSTRKATRVIPNKVYEALALGIPLITMRSPAIAELLCEDKHVLLVPPDNPEALAEAITKAKADYASVKEAAKRGQQLFAATCSPKHVAKLLDQIIDEVVANGASVRHNRIQEDRTCSTSVSSPLP